MRSIVDILSRLAVKRPVFHSEADFQHSLAWEIHSRWKQCSVRLEFKSPRIDRREYIDIWVRNKSEQIAIELKYKTAEFNCKFAEEDFKLLFHGAQDIVRYDFLKDILRLESLPKNIKRYAIFLTNDRSYWVPSDYNAISLNFRIHEDRNLGGILKWGEKAGDGTINGREEAVNLQGKYILKWRDYSEVNKSVRGQFRYLLVEI